MLFYYVLRLNKYKKTLMNNKLIEPDIKIINPSKNNMNRRRGGAVKDMLFDLGDSEATRKANVHTAEARAALYHIAPETARKVDTYEKLGLTLLSVLFVLQFVFIAPKVTDDDNDGVPWAVVFIPAYIFYGIWGLIAFGFPLAFGFRHAWYLFSGWFAMIFAWACTLTSLVLLVVHLEDPDKPNLDWAIYIPLIILGTYMALFYLWDFWQGDWNYSDITYTSVKDGSQSKDEEYSTE